jgi:hypothetical protein
MYNDQIPNADAADVLLTALAEQLGAVGERYDLVVVGGSALLALGLVQRPTRDVDVVALGGAEGLGSAIELPGPLLSARDRVAGDLGVTTDWLNSGPAGLLDFGLPEGFEERWTTRRYGSALTVRWASRLDQVHLKLYAAVDQAGKHLRDLEALAPTGDELVVAARWARTHDPSEGFLESLVQALAYFRVEDVDLGA